MNDSPTDPQRTARPIRSYVLRAGRMGSGQVRALAKLAPRYVLPFQALPLDVEDRKFKGAVRIEY